MEDNQDIIKAVLDGNRERYSELVKRYSKQTHALTFSYLQDTQWAEDVTQEAFIKAYCALPTLGSPKTFGAWLAQIARNLSFAALRKKKVDTEPLTERHEQPDTGSPNARQEIFRKETGELLRKALDKMSPKIREVMVLFYLKNESIRDVSEFLGISENAVKQRLHKGRKLLRERLEEAVGDGLKELSLSEHFLPGVMAALPMQIPKMGLAAIGLKLLTLPAFAYIVTFAYLLGVSKLMDRFVLMDIDPSRTDAKHSFLKVRWSIRGIALLGAIALLALLKVCGFVPGLRWILAAAPFLFFAYYWRTFLLLCPAWRCKIYAFCLAGVFSYMFYDMTGSFIDTDHFLWDKLLWTPIMIISVLLTLSATRSDEKKKRLIENAPEVEPVSIEFLQRHARDFTKILNTPYPNFSRVELLEDHVRFANPSFLRYVSKGSPDYSAGLYPDGTVLIEIEGVSTIPAFLGSPEEFKATRTESIRAQWAYYLAGDMKAARSLTLMQRSSKVFVRRRGARTMAALSLLLLALCILLSGSLFLLRSPRLHEDRLKTFYNGEFLAPEEGRPKVKLVIHYKYPPSMMSNPEVRDTYVELIRKQIATSETFKGDRNGNVISAFEIYLALLYDTDEMINGLEAGVLTKEMLSKWGFNREKISGLEKKDWCTLDPKILSGEKEFGIAGADSLKGICERVRFMNYLGLLDLMDSSLPEEIVKRCRYNDGKFQTSKSPLAFISVGATCHIACILTIFDRWDLADREQVRKTIIKWPGRHRHVRNASQLYDLALGLISVDGTEEYPLPRLASRIKPDIGVNSKKSPWSISPFDINEYAIKEILMNYRGQGFVLVPDAPATQE